MSDKDNAFYDTAIQDLITNDNKVGELRKSLSTGVHNNPDEYARYMSLSRSMGVDPLLLKDSSVRGELERRNTLGGIDVEGLVTTHPKAASWLSDPTNASLAHDSVNSLTNAERLLWAPIDFPRAAAEGFIGQGVGSFLSYAGGIVQQGLRGTVKLASIEAEQPLQDDEATYKQINDATHWMRIPGEGTKQMGRAIGPPKTHRWLGTDVAAGLGQITFQMALYAAGGPLTSNIAMFGQGFDQVDDAVSKDKASTGAKDAARILGGFATMITEAWGLQMLVNRVPSKLMNIRVARAWDLTKAAAYEGTQEFSEQLLQNIIRQQLTNKDQDLKEGLVDSAEVGAWVGFIARAVLGVKGVRHQLRLKEVFDGLNKTAEESPLAKRDPDGYTAWLRHASKDSPVSTVYVDADRFVQYFQEAGFDPKVIALEAGATNFDEAVNNEGRIEFPVADFSTKIANTPHLAELMEDTTLQADVPTMRTIRAIAAEQDALREQYKKDAAKIADRITMLDEKVQKLINKHVPAFTKLGFGAQQAKDQAALFRGLAVKAVEDANERAREQGREATLEEQSARIDEFVKKYTFILGGGRQMRSAGSQAVMTNLPALLGKLRTQTQPTHDEIYGKNLSRFMLEQGGVNDATFKDLHDISGVDPETMLSLVKTAGYISPEATVEDLRKLLRRDLRGARAYSELQKNQQLESEATMLHELDSFLRDQGIDPSAMTDDQVRGLIDATRSYRQPFDGKEVATTPIGDAVEIDVDGTMRPALNSDGKPIHWSQEGVRNFWRWFGDSKVVDADGRPVVVYHGTRASFDSFNPEVGNPVLGGGIYFSSNKEFSQKFAGTTGNNMSVYLRIENPLYNGFDGAGVGSLMSKSEYRDGGIFTKRQTDDYGDAGLKEFVVFQPEQIKSATGNSGAFSGDTVWNQSIINAPWFHSHLAKQVNSKAPFESAQGEQWAAWLRSKAPELRIKQDELYWSDVLAFLDLKGKERVSKQDVIDVIQNAPDGPLQIVEYNHGRHAPASYAPAQAPAPVQQNGPTLSAVQPSRANVYAAARDQIQADYRVWLEPLVGADEGLEPFLGAPPQELYNDDLASELDPEDHIRLEEFHLRMQDTRHAFNRGAVNQLNDVVEDYRAWVRDNHFLPEDGLVDVEEFTDPALDYGFDTIEQIINDDLDGDFGPAPEVELTVWRSRITNLTRLYNAEQAPQQTTAQTTDQLVAARLELFNNRVRALQSDYSQWLSNFNDTVLDEYTSEPPSVLLESDAITELDPPEAMMVQRFRLLLEDTYTAQATSAGTVLETALEQYSDWVMENVLTDAPIDEVVAEENGFGFAELSDAVNEASDDSPAIPEDFAAFEARINNLVMLRDGVVNLSLMSQIIQHADLPAIAQQQPAGMVDFLAPMAAAQQNQHSTEDLQRYSEMRHAVISHITDQYDEWFSDIIQDYQVDSGPEAEHLPGEEMDEPPLPYYAITELTDHLTLRNRDEGAYYELLDRYSRALTGDFSLENLTLAEHAFADRFLPPQLQAMQATFQAWLAENSLPLFARQSPPDNLTPEQEEWLLDFEHDWHSLAVELPEYNAAQQQAPTQAAPQQVAAPASDLNSRSARQAFAQQQQAHQSLSGSSYIAQYLVQGIGNPIPHSMRSKVIAFKKKTLPMTADGKVQIKSETADGIEWLKNPRDDKWYWTYENILVSPQSIVKPGATQEEVESAKEFAYRLVRTAAYENAVNYYHTVHFPHANPIFHTRYDLRWDVADVLSLFVHEAQGDQSQKGRDLGFSMSARVRHNKFNKLRALSAEVDALQERILTKKVSAEEYAEGLTSLTEAYQTWVELQGFELTSAENLLRRNGDTMSEAQKSWVEAFSKKWEAFNRTGGKADLISEASKLAVQKHEMLAELDKEEQDRHSGRNNIEPRAFVANQVRATIRQNDVTEADALEALGISKEDLAADKAAYAALRKEIATRKENKKPTAEEQATLNSLGERGAKVSKYLAENKTFDVFYGAEEKDGKRSPKKEATFKTQKEAEYRVAELNDKQAMESSTTAWVKLMLSRLIHEAVAVGAKQVMFTTGDQQLQIYSSYLTSIVGSVDYDPATKTLNTYDVSGRRRSGNVKNLASNKSDEHEKGPFSAYLNATPDALVDLLGAENAKELLDAPVTEFGVQELKPQSAFRISNLRGMRAIYDRLYPIIFNDFLDEVGANTRVTTTRLVENGPLQVTIKITPELEQKARDTFALSYNQANDAGSRGSISIKGSANSGGAQISINMFQNANMSTFVHEMGHFYFQMLYDMATSEGATQRAKDDYATVLKLLGITHEERMSREAEYGALQSKISLENRTATPEEAAKLTELAKHQEDFAKLHEAYLMEGKSPSPAVAGVFARFTEWLTAIYESITSLGVTLNKDARDIFDRIYATNAEIQMAQAENDFHDLTAEMLGMTPERYNLYKTMVEAEANAAKNTLREELMRVLRMRNESWWNVQRQKERKQVAKEIAQRPEYAAFDKLIVVGSEEKLNKDELVSRFGHDITRRLLRGYGKGKGVMYAEDGMSLDVAADLFGYSNGEELISALLTVEPRDVVLDRVSQQRMYDRHSDLMEKAELRDEAQDAVHNKARAERLLTELHAMETLARTRTDVKPDPEPSLAEQVDKSIIAKPKAANRKAATAEQQARWTAAEERLKAQILKGAVVMPSLEVYRTAAAEAVSEKLVKDIKPNTYLISARKFSRAAFQAMGRQDYKAARSAKHAELLNHFMYVNARAAMKEVAKAERLFKLVRRGNDAKLSKSRDLVQVMQARVLLADHGHGDATAAKTYLDVASNQENQDYTNYVPLNNWGRYGTPTQNMMLLDFEAFHNEIAGLWSRSRDDKMIEVGDKRMTKEAVLAELQDQFNRIDKKGGVAKRLKGVSEGDKNSRLLQTYVAHIRRAESWATAMDAGRKLGPFWKYIFSRMSTAATLYRDEITKARREILAAAKTVDWKRELIASPELGYSFGEDYRSRGVGLNEVIGALLHTGNDSNLRKMLLGKEWAELRADGSLDTSKWDAFIARLISEGKLDKTHFDFVQRIWDLNEGLKGGAQRAHRKLYGYYFKEITAKPFTTPWGEYRGGYVPAIIDAAIVEDAALRAVAQAENDSLVYAFPTTGRGFTMARSEGYTKALELNVNGLTRHADKVLLFTHMQPAANDVMKIFKDKDFVARLGTIDPAAMEGLLLPWITRATKQIVETPSGSMQGLARMFSVLRGRAGALAMFGNIGNAVQQATGLMTGMVDVKPGFMTEAAAQYLAGPAALTEAVKEKSLYMKNRMAGEIHSMNYAINEIITNPGLLKKSEAFTMQHAYFLQAGADNIIGTMVWTGAYNQALAGGMTEEEAVQMADRTVRTTQASTLAEDISNAESGSAFVRMFTQFSGWFNANFNKLYDEFLIAHRTTGIGQNKARLAYVMMMGFFLQSWVAEAITLAARGGPDDDDKDGSYLDDWLKQVFLFGTLKSGAAMFTKAGQALMLIINLSDDKIYNDRFTTPPAAQLVERALTAPARIVANTVKGKDIKPKDVLDATATTLAATTGIQTGPVASRIGVAANIATGKTNPTGPVDLTRALVTGRESPQSKK